MELVAGQVCDVEEKASLQPEQVKVPCLSLCQGLTCCRCFSRALSLNLTVSGSTCNDAQDKGGPAGQEQGLGLRSKVQQAGAQGQDAGPRSNIQWAGLRI